MTQDLSTAMKLAADPSTWMWPPTLPVEIALKTATIKELCEEYNISRADWLIIKETPAFQAEVVNAIDMLRKDGMDFKMRAQLQSKELLKRIWEMTHASFDIVPPSVQADLIKFTVKAAGLDASKDQAQAEDGQKNAFMIQINL